MNNPCCFLYAGPTLYQGDGLPLRLPDDVCLLPPAQRGDIPRLVQAHPAGTLVLADGLFHQVLAVGHVELRDALKAGWRVWGLSSMGAIRACEMQNMGMRGFGRVYEMFAGAADFQDDEVALLHAPEPPYVSVSEPLVHLRHALTHLCALGLLDRANADAIAAHLKTLWYGERLLCSFTAQAVAGAMPHSRAQVQAALEPFDRYRLKTLDLAAFLAGRVWETPPDTSPSPQ